MRNPKGPNVLTRIRVASAAWFLSFALIGAAPAPHAPYSVGQVWSYHTRPGELFSLLRINRIQLESRAGPLPIYHISIVGVHLGGSSKPNVIDHLPVSRETLDASVIHLVNSSEKFPDSDSGITQWQSAHGGVFTIPVAEIVEIVDRTARQTVRH